MRCKRLGVSTKILTLMCLLGGLLNVPPALPAPSAIAQALSQAETTASVGVPRSNPAADTRMTPWYKDPTVTAFAGAIAAFLAALIAAWMNLLVRIRTNRHELHKLLLEKRLIVYGQIFEKIAEFDSFEARGQSEELLNKLIGLLADFQRSYPFLDKRTIDVFDERLSQPFKTGELGRILKTQGEEVLYEEIRGRLLEVLQTAKTFLDRFKWEE